jgi:Ca2+-binding RTX toxin-like protein
MTFYVIDDSNSINNTASGGNGLMLAAGDSLFLKSTGSILETGPNGTGLYVNAYADNAQVTIQGTVYGTQSGIYSLAQNALFNITGQVFGGFVSEASGTIVNVGTTGYIQGDMGMFGGTFNNSGTIDIGNNEFQIDSQAFINNHGLITSAGIAFGYDGGDDVYLSNYGTIHGAFLSQDTTHKIQLENYGMWTAFSIQLSGGDDYFTNQGTVTGNVDLGAGNDLYDGSKGDTQDEIYGDAGNDSIAAGNENNMIAGGAGADTMDGGGGSNTLDYLSSAIGVYIDLGNNIAKRGDAAGDHISHFQNVYGTLKADTLIGDDGDNVIYGVIGSDNITANGGNDTIVELGKGHAHLNGGAGNDIFLMQTADLATYGPAFSNADQIDGGSGFDTLELAGSAISLTLTSAVLANVERIQMGDGYNYTLTTVDGNVASGQNLEVDASGLVTNQLAFNGSAELDGTFAVDGGGGKDTIVGGAKADTLAGNGNADTLTGGGGADTFVYNDVSDSTSTKYDVVTDFNASADKFTMPDTPAAVDAMVSSGTLSAGSFNNDVKNAVNGHLLANDAILFHATAGGLAGHTILVVDANGSAGYQAGADFVIDVTGYSGTFDITDFN